MASRESSVVAPASEPVIAVPIDTASVADSSAESASAELEEWIRQLVRGGDTSVTLGMWMADHRGDVVSRTIPTGMSREPLCRSATALVSAGRRIWRRSAVFVIPQPPSGESLPDDAGAQRLCTLRALWLESADRDSARAERAAAMLSRRLSRALGGGRPGVAMTGSGTGQWRGAASWERGLHVVVVGTAPAYASSPETDAEPVTRPATAVAVSYVIGNGLDKSVSALIDQQEYPKVTPEALTEVARADSAIGWSGVSGLAPLRGLFASYLDSAQFDERTERPPAGKLTPEALTEVARADSAIGWSGVSGLAPLRGLFASHLDSAHFDERTERPSPNATVDSVLLRALAALRDTASLPPPQRAAAFLAADIAVQVHAGALGYSGRDSVLRVQLERLGARYQDDHLGAAYFYLRPWLWRAYQTDSAGPAGKSAFAELLRAGWTTALACADGGDRTKPVIERGERALDAGLDDPMVHMYVAQAYADVFSLSPAGVSEAASAPARALAERAETARLRAIEHYRKALADVKNRALRRSIWNNAVRLMLRLPIETRYFCEYD